MAICIPLFFFFLRQNRQILPSQFFLAARIANAAVKPVLPNVLESMDLGACRNEIRGETRRLVAIRVGVLAALAMEVMDLQCG